MRCLVLDASAYSRVRCVGWPAGIAPAVRAAEPDLEGDFLVTAVAEALGQTERRVRMATRYYAAHPDEIDARIAFNTELADEAEAAWLTEQRLLRQPGDQAS